MGSWLKLESVALILEQMRSETEADLAQWLADERVAGGSPTDAEIARKAGSIAKAKGATAVGVAWVESKNRFATKADFERPTSPPKKADE